MPPKPIAAECRVCAKPGIGIRKRGPRSKRLQIRGMAILVDLAKVFVLWSEMCKFDPLMRPAVGPDYNVRAVGVCGELEGLKGVCAPPPSSF